MIRIALPKHHVEDPRVARFHELTELANQLDPSPHHGERVAELCLALAERLKWAPEDQIRLHQAARLVAVAQFAGDVLDGQQQQWLRYRAEPANSSPEGSQLIALAEAFCRDEDLVKVDRLAGTAYRADGGELLRAVLGWWTQVN